MFITITLVSNALQHAQKCLSNPKRERLQRIASANEELSLVSCWSAKDSSMRAPIRVKFNDTIEEAEIPKDQSPPKTPKMFEDGEWVKASWLGKMLGLEHDHITYNWHWPEQNPQSPEPKENPFKLLAGMR